MNEERGSEVAAPRWLELAVLVAAASMAAVGVIGLAGAVMGQYSTALTLALSAPVVVVAVVALARALPARPTRRATQAAALVAVLIAVGFGAFAGSRPSQNVLVDRDPGSYTNTARHLVDEGTLEVDARGSAFAGVSGLTFTSQAVYDVGTEAAVEPGGAPEPSGQIEFQFNHTTSVLLAAAYDVGGIRAMFRLPALASAVGLVAVYAVAVRASRRPWASLLAPALLGVALPMLYVSRNTYSEPFTLVPLWGAMLALAAFHRRPHPALAAVGGALAGATVCVRVDALLYVALAVPLAGVSLAVAGPLRAARRRGWAVAAGAAAVPATIGLYDLTARTGGYADDLADQIALLRMGGVALVVATVAAVVAWERLGWVRGTAQRWQRPVAAAGAVLVGLTFLAGWLVRPRVQTGRLDDPIELIGNLQRRDGLAVDAYASYAEDSLRWMAWYLGAPALLVAIAGLGWVTHRSLRGRVEPAALATLVLCLGGGGLYWWEPSITPDQLWATRRFVPAAIPALAVMASIAFGAAVAWTDRIERVRVPAAARSAVAALVAVLLVLPAQQATAPVADHTMQQGFVLPLQQLCDGLGDDAAVLVVGPSADSILQQGVRSWCRVPTAAAASTLTRGDVAEMAATVAANGYRLHLVSRDEAGIVEVDPSAAGAIGASDLAVNDTNALATVDRAPTSYGGAFGLQLFWTPVEPA